MNDIFYTGSVIFAIALGSLVGAAEGWSFFGMTLMFGGLVNYFDNNRKIYSGKIRTKIHAILAST